MGRWPYHPFPSNIDDEIRILTRSNFTSGLLSYTRFFDYVTLINLDAFEYYSIYLSHTTNDQQRFPWASGAHCYYEEKRSIIIASI